MHKKMDNYSNYIIYNNGDVFSLKANRFLKHRFLNSGYQYVDLYDDNKNKKPKRFLVHRLVAILFVDGFKNGLEVNHKDKNKKNSNYTNLEWVTRSQNANHKYLTYQYPVGSNHCKSKLNEETVLKIKKLFLQGEKIINVSKMLNIKYSTLSEIKHQRTWGHVKVVA
jgi:hypothetical protein